MKLRDLTTLHLALVVALLMFVIAGLGTWAVRNWLGLGALLSLVPVALWLALVMWFTTAWWKARRVETTRPAPGPRQQ